MNPAPDLYLRGSASFGQARLFGPVDITLPAGRWSCLLGPSGVGKSTILNLLAGIATDVRFDGSFGASDNHRLGGRIALMAQEDLLLPWLDLAHNVTIGARLRGDKADLKRAQDLLQEVGLGAHLHKRPSELSGGQRQRVALARTLMEDRPVVLLDEPFSALDARTRADMQDLAATMLKGRTVLHVTHDPAEAARLGHQILVLSQAELTSIEPPASPTPRPVDDSKVLSLQADLLNFLRQDPSCAQPNS
ncbi:ATP-binding cassette domain-containing protein [Epibacterium sp. SM1969]|uniref:ATP-binding cassette domain-containing protein n=1 Tax=Tritonibacter aquimaris TaxID=2663379 RepID=A0A844B134_9RHOB|nr:ABC transporter ATP-binding protein [Tritonibacter aquimaris]MQY44254.1 ATP-binding cassette domain-containing protein [Tritonibacter aquimaris]